MKAERKPRADSILDGDALSDAQRDELRDKLLAGASHSACKAWLRTLGVPEIKGKDTLTRFWRRHCLPIVHAERSFAAMKAEAYGDSMVAAPVDWVAKILERIKQLAFELMIDPTPDSAKVKELVDALVKLDKQSLDREKFTEALKKANAAQKVSNDEALSEEEKSARIKQIFRMG